MGLALELLCYFLKGFCKERMFVKVMGKARGGFGIPIHWKL